MPLSIGHLPKRDGYLLLEESIGKQLETQRVPDIGSQAPTSWRLRGLLDGCCALRGTEHSQLRHPQPLQFTGCFRWCFRGTMTPSGKLTWKVKVTVLMGEQSISAGFSTPGLVCHFLNHNEKGTSFNKWWYKLSQMIHFLRFSAVIQHPNDSKQTHHLKRLGGSSEGPKFDGHWVQFSSWVETHFSQCPSPKGPKGCRIAMDCYCFGRIKIGNSVILNQWKLLEFKYI